MDKLDMMFEPDPVVSHLYLESFKPRHQLEPEKELMLAVLTDAIECMQKHSDSRQATGIKLYQEAKEWIFDENERDAFSFLNICAALNLDPCYIRRGIAGLKSAWLGGRTANKTLEKLEKAYRSDARRKPKVRGRWSPYSPGRAQQAARTR
jgi:hypothetical protein